MAPRKLLWSWKTEPDAVFENLQWTRMKVQLKDSDRADAIAAIEDVLKKFQEDDKPHVLFSIACAVQKELFKSKEIDVEIIKKLAALYPRHPGEDDDDHHHDDNRLAAAAGDFKLSADAEEEEEDEADDDDDDADAADEDWEEYVTEDEAVADGGDDDDLKKREAAMKEFEEAGINELKRRCNIMGCSLKQGQEQEILSVIISLFRVDDEYHMKRCIEFFMSRVKGYISSSCTLDDLETVRKAVESAKKEREAYADQIHQLLGKNTVPTNEEGIATPMNQLKQEKTECGIECEIATPFNLPEQEEICLTPPECEDMKTEECGIATPMNQPEQEENMVDVNFCLTPLWEDTKTEECATKRKLAQL